MWRIVGVHSGRFGNNIFDDPGKRAVISRIFSLVKRLVPREESGGGIYDDVYSAVSLLDRGKVSKEELDGLEILVVLRILRALGYLSNDERFEPLMVSGDWEPSLLSLAYNSRNFAVLAINNSLRESQL
jgi:hypothetical protein